MITDVCKYVSDFNFNRNGKQSQIDWCFGNEYSPSVTGFNIIRDCRKISDHKPIAVEIHINGEPSLDSILNATNELNESVSNHTNIPVIRNENTYLILLENLITRN